MSERKTYRVETWRDGRFIMVSIPELNGLTQAMRPGEVEAMARDWVALTLDVPEDSFDLELPWSEE